ncbi:MAG TPA: glycosyltransferase [Phycisphaerae bacterium]|nr:glycosyltransferase [Phycisphaerae bacterium]
MRILYVAIKHDYGNPARGFSFEHWSLYHSLVSMGHDILYFDYVGLLGAMGRDAMNRRLWEVARSEQADLMFTVLYEEQLDRSVVRRISEELQTVTVSWFCDDHWRFERFSRHWAPCFNWCVTTARSALPKYAAIGYGNVIKSQWACNPFLYRKLDVPLEHDVTFVGQPHGNRRAIIEALRAAGVRVQTWGYGWPAGRLGQEQMIRVFNTSRINLNLPNPAMMSPTPGESRRRNLKLRTGEFLRRMPGGMRARGLAHRVWGGLRRFRPGVRLSPPDLISDPNDQIKGRNFEVPACGAFLLSGQAEELSEYYEDGREIVCYSTMTDLIEKARRYLADEAERAAIAQRGYERTLREHTYEHRFADLFARVGLPQAPAAEVLAASPRPGHTEYVR